MGKLSKIPPIRPIVIGGFTLAEQGMEVRGHPSFEDYQGVGEFIRRAHVAAGWWLADWILYGDSRPEWKHDIDQSVGIDQYTDQTVRQYRYIAKKFPVNSRIDGVSFGHHSVVVNVEPELREKLLKQAAIEGWTTRELTHAAKGAEKPTVIAEGQAAEVHDVEVTVLVTLEAQTPNLAENAAFEFLKTTLKATKLSAPLLKTRVLMMRARPKYLREDG